MPLVTFPLASPPRASSLPLHLLPLLPSPCTPAKHCCPPASAPPPKTHTRTHPRATHARRFYSGRDVCLGLTLGLYEPQLPEATGAADLTPQHAAWAEDHVMHGLDEAGIPVAVVARLTACIDEFVMG
jgi:hypothetical protein